MNPVLAVDTLSGETLLPVGIAAAVLFSAVGGALWLQRQFNDLKTVIVELRTELDTIRKESKSNWCRTEMRLWASELRLMNPTLKIPDVVKISDEA